MHRRVCNGLMVISVLGLATMVAALEKPSPAVLAKGKAIYNMHCAACHGAKGDGNGPAGMALNPKPRNLVKGPYKMGTKPDQVAKVVANGLPGTMMVGYKQVIGNPADIHAVAQYVVSLRK